MALPKAPAAIKVLELPSSAFILGFGRGRRWCVSVDGCLHPHVLLQLNPNTVTVTVANPGFEESGALKSVVVRCWLPLGPQIAAGHCRTSCPFGVPLTTYYGISTSPVAFRLVTLSPSYEYLIFLPTQTFPYLSGKPDRIFPRNCIFTTRS